MEGDSNCLFCGSREFEEVPRSKKDQVKLDKYGMPKTPLRQQAVGALIGIGISATIVYVVFKVNGLI